MKRGALVYWFVASAVMIPAKSAIAQSPLPAVDGYDPLSAVMPQLAAIVERTLGTPAAGGFPTVRLRRELLAAPDTGPLAQVVTPTLVKLDSLWLQGWLARGAIVSVCPSDTNSECERGAATVIVTLSGPTFLSAECAIVDVRIDTDGFAAAVRLSLERRAGVWTPVSRAVRWIT